MIKVKRTIHFQQGERGRGRIAKRAAATETVERGRIPRVSKLMALAIRFDWLLREGLVADQSELARLAHVTQPRMTQIMNLLHLAPDIQEELLFLPHTTEGRDPITERDIRSITGTPDWKKQKKMWDSLLRSSIRDGS